MRHLVGAAALFAVLSTRAGAGGSESRTLYVNCGGPPGDGSWSAPYDSITASLQSAEALSTSYRVTINVRGVCRAETFPLSLDFPVHLQGQRLGKYDSQGWPLPDAWRDTVIVRPASTPVPASMVRITADGVRISRISLDGELVLPPDGNAGPPANAPIGILAHGADGLSIEGVRVSNTTLGIRSVGSSGTITGCHVGPANSGLGVFGGDPADETTVLLLNNRILYRVNGIGVAGGISANPALGQPAGTELTLHMWRNDIATTYTETGPTNPAAIRFSPVAELATDGHMDATVLYNRIGGPTKYAIMVHGGPQVAFGGGPYTGSVDAMFLGTTLDEAAELASVSIVTFTNARATIAPDPRFLAAPYLQDAVYRLWHGGELDTVSVDHPATQDHPAIGGLVELDNELFINDQLIDNRTFVP